MAETKLEGDKCEGGFPLPDFRETCKHCGARSNEGCRRPDYSATVTLHEINRELVKALTNLLADNGVSILEDAARTDPNDTDTAKGTANLFRAARAAVALAEGM